MNDQIQEEMSEAIDEIILGPIVHLNGASSETLIEQRSEVWNALEAVRDAMKKAAPNGRDFYPEPGRLEKAEAQHRRRLETIDALQREIEAEMDLISETA